MRYPIPVVWLLCTLTAPSLSAPVPKSSPLLLELRLRAVTAKVKPDPRIHWEVVIINRGKKPVTLVQPGDGSDCGWRTPVLEWIVDGKVDGQATVKMEKVTSDVSATKPELQPICLTERGMRIGRCGNINGLKANEVFDLQPGKEVKLNEWVGSPSLSAGKHHVALRYFNIPTLKWKGLPLGKHDEKAMDRIKRSLRMTLQSKTVEILVQQ